MIRLVEDAKLVNHMVPVSRNAGTVNGTGIDTTGYDGACFMLVCGDIAATTTVDLKVQESDDNSNWSDITSAAITQLGATDDNKLPTIDVRLGARASRKKYVRGVLVSANSTCVVACVVALYHAEQQPQTQTVAAVVV